MNYDQDQLEDFLAKARKVLRQGATEADYKAADLALHVLEGRDHISEASTKYRYCSKCSTRIVFGDVCERECCDGEAV